MDGNNNKKRIFPWKCYNHIFIMKRIFTWKCYNDIFVMNKMNSIMNHHSSKRWKERVVHFYSFWRWFHEWINKQNNIEIILENILWKYILENKGIKVALLFFFLMKYLIERMIIIAIDKNETFFVHLIRRLLPHKSVTFWEVKVLNFARSTSFILLFEGNRKNIVKNKIVNVIERAKKNWHFTNVFPNFLYSYSIH